MTYDVSAKIGNSVVKIGRLTSKIPSDKWKSFKEKYEEKDSLKILN